MHQKRQVEALGDDGTENLRPYSEAETNTGGEMPGIALSCEVPRVVRFTVGCGKWRIVDGKSKPGSFH